MIALETAKAGDLALFLTNGAEVRFLCGTDVTNGEICKLVHNSPGVGTLCCSKRVLEERKDAKIKNHVLARKVKELRAKGKTSQEIADILFPEANACES